MCPSTVDKSTEPCATLSSSLASTSLISNSNPIGISTNDTISLFYSSSSSASSAGVFFSDGKRKGTSTFLQRSGLGQSSSNDYYTNKRIEHLQERMDDMQVVSFVKFLNFHLPSKYKPIEMKNLAKDLSNGHVWLDLIEILSSKKLKRENGATRFHALTNVQNVLDYLKSRMQHVNISPHEIITGNRKQILALLWIIMKTFDFPGFRLTTNRNFFSEQTLFGYGQDRSEILKWLNHLLDQSYQRHEIYIDDFHLNTWISTCYFIAILKYLLPISPNYLTEKSFHYLKQFDDQHRTKENLFQASIDLSTFAFSTTSKIDYQDKTEKCLMRFFSEFQLKIFHCLKTQQIGKLAEKNSYIKQLIDTIVRPMQTGNGEDQSMMNHQEQYLICLQDEQQPKTIRAPINSIGHSSSSSSDEEFSNLRTVEKSRSFQQQQIKNVKRRDRWNPTNQLSSESSFTDGDIEHSQQVNGQKENEPVEPATLIVEEIKPVENGVESSKEDPEPVKNALVENEENKVFEEISLPNGKFHLTLEEEPKPVETVVNHEPLITVVEEPKPVENSFEHFESSEQDPEPVIIVDEETRSLELNDEQQSALEKQESVEPAVEILSQSIETPVNHDASIVVPGSDVNVGTLKGTEQDDEEIHHALEHFQSEKLTEPITINPEPVDHHYETSDLSNTTSTDFDVSLSPAIETPTQLVLDDLLESKESHPSAELMEERPSSPTIRTDDKSTINKKEEAITENFVSSIIEEKFDLSLEAEPAVTSNQSTEQITSTAADVNEPTSVSQENFSSSTIEPSFIVIEEENRTTSIADEQDRHDLTSASAVIEEETSSTRANTQETNHDDNSPQSIVEPANQASLSPLSNLVNGDHLSNENPLEIVDVPQAVPTTEIITRSVIATNQSKRSVPTLEHSTFNEETKHCAMSNEPSSSSLSQSITQPVSSRKKKQYSTYSISPSTMTEHRTVQSSITNNNNERTKATNELQQASNTSTTKQAYSTVLKKKSPTLPAANSTMQPVTPTKECKTAVIQPLKLVEVIQQHQIQLAPVVSHEGPVPKRRARRAKAKQQKSTLVTLQLPSEPSLQDDEEEEEEEPKPPSTTPKPVPVSPKKERASPRPRKQKKKRQSTNNMMEKPSSTTMTTSPGVINRTPLVLIKEHLRDPRMIMLKYVFVLFCFCFCFTLIILVVHQ